MAGHWNAVSVPDGAPSSNTKDYSSKFDYLDAAKDKLDSVKWFILAVDNDAPGQKLEEELARRLGRERCRRVIWPEGCKDANDVLLKHGKEALVACIDQAKPYPLAGVFEVLDLSDKVTAIYERGMPPAAPTGWRALEGLYSVRPGELTVITGIPSHGKSAFLDAMMINLARKEGWSFGVFSPENQPLEMHVSKLAETAVGKPFTQGHTERMNVDELDQAIAWLHQHSEVHSSGGANYGVHPEPRQGAGVPLWHPGAGNRPVERGRTLSAAGVERNGVHQPVPEPHSRIRTRTCRARVGGGPPNETPEGQGRSVPRTNAL